MTDRYNGPDRREPPPKQWHLDKSVPISLIVTLLMYGVAGLWAFADVKKDVEVLKIQTVQQRDRDERQDKVSSEALALVRNQLERMESKIDRLVEKRAGQ